MPEHGKLDEKYSRTPPKDGLIVKVNGRILDVKGNEFCRGTCSFAGGMKSSRDFLWITADEAASMLPVRMEHRFQYPMPPAIARRLTRFHLVDNTRGEPRFWKSKDARTTEIKLTVAAVTAEHLTLQVDGVAKFESDLQKRGYDARLGGTIRYDRKAKAYDQFDIAAVGDHWGDDSVTDSGARPGKTPLGVAFSQADPKLPSERVSPAARDWDIYMGKRDD